MNLALRPVITGTSPVSTERTKGKNDERERTEVGRAVERGDGGCARRPNRSRAFGHRPLWDALVAAKTAPIQPECRNAGSPILGRKLQHGVAVWDADRLSLPSWNCCSSSFQNLGRIGKLRHDFHRRRHTAAAVGADLEHE
jgi:hypothetical protein